jgi:CHAT domain-containing protein/tetratricopeptide (TPR) repeat protein
MATAPLDAFDEALRCLESGDPERIEHSLTLLRTAEDGFPRSRYPIEWGSVQVNLGIALVQRAHGSRAANVEEALRRFDAAQEIFGEAEWPRPWADLLLERGTAYLKRPLGDIADNVERAKACFERALCHFEQTDRQDQMGRALANLGLAYASRLRGERTVNIDHAIDHYHAALGLLTDDQLARQRADVYSNLGGAYLERRSGRWQDNIEDAIDSYTRALTISKAHSPPAGFADVQSNLGFAYWRRAQGDRRWNLEQALCAFAGAQDALTDASAPTYAWAELGMSYVTAELAQISGDRAMLKRAIAQNERAVELISRRDTPMEWAEAQNALGHTLATFASSEYDAQRRALAAYQRALEVFTLPVNPIARQRTLVNLGDLRMDREEWAEALRAYEGAIEAGERVFATAYTDDGRRDAAGAISPVYMRAAYCAVRVQTYGRGLELLDRGKTRILAEGLRLRSAQLDPLPLQLRSRLKQAQNEVLALESRTTPVGTPSISSAADAVADLASASERLMKAITDAEDLGVHLLPVGLSAGEIMALAPAGGALVAPLVTTHGAIVLVVPHGQRPERRHIVDLTGFTDDIVDRILRGDATEPGWLEAYRRVRERGAEADIHDWEACVLRTTGLLWDALVGPIDRTLRTEGVPTGAPILLLTQGKLAVLPLHAAWRVVDGVKRPFSEDWIISYSPGAAPLQAVLGREQSRRRREPDLLAISDPAANLAFARLEVAAIQSQFAEDHRTVLDQTTATRASVVARARTCTHLHFACHGAFDSKDPTASPLQLAGTETLTVAEVFDDVTLDGAILTVLSACESGIVDVEGAPDEAIGFAAAFLDAGSTGVISTLWAVDDASTAILMEHFYQLLGQSIPAPVALAEATRWLRTATASDLDVAEWWERAGASSGSDDERVRAEKRRRSPELRPFEAPQYWAPFIYTGPPALV